MAKEHTDRLNVISDIQDESKKRQLRIEDDEEDFLDESKLTWFHNAVGSPSDYRSRSRKFESHLSHII